MADRVQLLTRKDNTPSTAPGTNTTVRKGGALPLVEEMVSQFPPKLFRVKPITLQACLTLQL